MSPTISIAYLEIGLVRKLVNKATDEQSSARAIVGSRGGGNTVQILQTGRSDRLVTRCRGSGGSRCQAVATLRTGAGLGFRSPLRLRGEGVRCRNLKVRHRETLQPNLRSKHN